MKTEEEIRRWHERRVPCGGVTYGPLVNYCPCDQYFEAAEGEPCMGEPEDAFERVVSHED